MNPNAIILWSILAIIGWLTHGTINGVLGWTLAGLLISLLATIRGR